MVYYMSKYPMYLLPKFNNILNFQVRWFSLLELSQEHVRLFMDRKLFWIIHMYIGNKYDLISSLQKIVFDLFYNFILSIANALLKNDFYSNIIWEVLLCFLAFDITIEDSSKMRKEALIYGTVVNYLPWNIEYSIISN